MKKLLFIVFCFPLFSFAQVGTLFYAQEDDSGSMSSNSGANITGGQADFTVSSWPSSPTSANIEFLVYSDCDDVNNPANCVPQDGFAEILLIADGLGTCAQFQPSNGQLTEVPGETFSLLEVSTTIFPSDCSGANPEDFYIQGNNFTNSFYYPSRLFYLASDSSNTYPYARIAINGTVPPPTPDNVTTRITEIFRPILGNISTSTTVLFEYEYYNGTTMVITAFGEVRNLTDGIQYALPEIAPLASGLNDYSATLELESGKFHMWRPVLNIGTSSPLIYGSWQTFDVVVPSGAFTPDPAFWGNVDPWDVGATSTLDLASSTCIGIESGILANTCKLVAWLFVPPPFATTFVNDLVVNFYNAFPFNLILVAKDTVFAINTFDWDTYDPEEVSVMTLDFTNATSTAGLGSINLLSKTTIENSIPDSFANTVRSLLEIAIYLAFIVALVMGIHKHFEK